MRLPRNIPCLCLSLLLLTPQAFAQEDLRRNSPVVRAVERVSSAVVNISSEYVNRSPGSPSAGYAQNPRFDSFFRDFFEQNRQQKVEQTSLGSGVIIDGKRGFVLTNTHVITQASTIHVTLKDDRRFEAQIVGADSESDLAVLKLSSPTPLPSVEMGASDDLLIGETVIAIGNPFGFSNTVTTGVISALNRNVRTDEVVYRNFIQTDASINPGNSGGPLLNINGDLIGINTAVYSSAQGIGFAIPINTAKRIVTDLIKYGEVIQPWIGIGLQRIDNRLAEYLTPDGKRGVLVNGVEPGSPAQKAGLQSGDILIAMNRHPVDSEEAYQEIMHDIRAGDTVSISFLRKNREAAASLTAQVFPVEAALDLAYSLFSIRVDESPRRRSGIPIASVASGSYLARSGIAPGDVIRALDETVISSLEDFKKAVVKSRSKKTVVLLIQRGPRLYNIPVPLS